MFRSLCAEYVEFLSQERSGAVFIERRHGEGQTDKQGLCQRKRSERVLTTYGRYMLGWAALRLCGSNREFEHTWCCLLRLSKWAELSLCCREVNSSVVTTTLCQCVFQTHSLKFTTFTSLVTNSTFKELFYRLVSQLVSWCLELCQPQTITSGLNTNSTLAPAYSFHKSSHPKSCFLSQFIFRGHSTREPASSRMDLFYSAGLHRNRCQPRPTQEKKSEEVLKGTRYNRKTVKQLLDCAQVTEYRYIPPFIFFSSVHTSENFITNVTVSESF